MGDIWFSELKEEWGKKAGKNKILIENGYSMEEVMAIIAIEASK